MQVECAQCIVGREKDNEMLACERDDATDKEQRVALLMLVLFVRRV